MVRTPTPRRRAGFTLIELLVVIAIIAILVALTAAGIFKLLAKGPEVQTRSDISQLAGALQNFKTEYKSYPPSKIKLYSNRADYNSDLSNPTNPDYKLAQDSISWINRLWPNITWTDIRWDGSGSAWPAGRHYYLEGDQCLVFFLGGIPGPGPICQGFATNAKDPSFHIKNPAAASMKKGPLFDFNSARLYQRKNQPGNVASPFYSYLDPHGKQPFVYFSSGAGKNQYDPINHAINFTPAAPELPIQVMPYYKPAPANQRPQFHNPDSFQIISAGADYLFGPGGPWTPSDAASVVQQGKDDMTNFHDRLMGVPQ